MPHLMLPASPSWYCSRATDSNDKGLMCVGAKHSLYLLLFSPNQLGPTCVGQISAHQDRVTSVSFSRHGNQTNLCSGSDDMKVKIWDVESKLVIDEHSEHKVGYYHYQCHFLMDAAGHGMWPSENVKEFGLQERSCS